MECSDHKTKLPRLLVVVLFSATTTLYSIAIFEVLVYLCLADVSLGIKGTSIRMYGAYGTMVCLLVKVSRRAAPLNRRHSLTIGSKPGN